MTYFARALIGCALVSLTAPAFAAEMVALEDGSAVQLETVTPLSSKANKVGDRVELKVSEDVKAGGQVVIARGSPAYGEVTKVAKKGQWGKPGRIEARLLYVSAGERQIGLDGAIEDSGKRNRTAALAGAALIFPTVGIWVTGTSAKLDAGTPAVGYIDNDGPDDALAASVPAPVTLSLR